MTENTEPAAPFDEDFLVQSSPRLSGSMLSLQLDASPIPVFAWSPSDGHPHLVGCNQAADLLIGSRARRGIGARLDEIFPERNDLVEDHRRCLSEHLPFRRALELADHETNETRPVVMSYAPVGTISSSCTWRT